MASSLAKRACDACHKRKVRCTGGQTCENCRQASLPCTYNSIPRKKGPKGSKGKVILCLKDSEQQANLAQQIQDTPGKGDPLDFSDPFTSPTSKRDPIILSPNIVNNCIRFFFSLLYPTMPILHRQQLEELVDQVNVPTEAYCLVRAFCAFMMIQPGMAFSIDFGETSENKSVTANTLIEDVLSVRRAYDFAEAPTLVAVQTSFFLFMLYGTLGRQNKAWFHLREASTLAQLNGMHDESTYLVGNQTENIYRRRLYWLLFVSERADAIGRRRPPTLHAVIKLPEIDEVPSDSEIISGLLHLVSLFTLIKDDYLGLWNKTRDGTAGKLLAQLQHHLRTAVSSNLSGTEAQIADIRVSHHWLRMMVWQLSVMNGNLSSSAADSSMAFTYPIEITKDLIRDIHPLSLQSFEANGIGLTEKIFDIACTLTDVITCVPHDTSICREAPSNYLNHFLTLIPQLHGGTSRFFPLLLMKVSENLPLMIAPTNHIPIGAGPEYSGFSDSSRSLSWSVDAADIENQMSV